RVLEDRRHPAAPEPLSRHETPKTAAPPHANTPEAQAPAPGAASDLVLVRTARALEARGWAAGGTGGSQRRPGRSYSGIVRRCVVFSTTAGAVHCTRPVYGCVRPYRMYAPRWSATCKLKKGACRVAVDTSGRLH